MAKIKRYQFCITKGFDLKMQICNIKIISQTISIKFHLDKTQECYDVLK